jgi:hypothetical protein
LQAHLLFLNLQLLCSSCLSTVHFIIYRPIRHRRWPLPLFPAQLRPFQHYRSSPRPGSRQLLGFLRSSVQPIYLEVASFTRMDWVGGGEVGLGETGCERDEQQDGERQSDTGGEVSVLDQVRRRAPVVIRPFSFPLQRPFLYHLFDLLPCIFALALEFCSFPLSDLMYFWRCSAIGDGASSVGSISSEHVLIRVVRSRSKGRSNRRRSVVRRGWRGEGKRQAIQGNREVTLFSSSLT